MTVSEPYVVARKPELPSHDGGLARDANIDVCLSCAIFTAEDSTGQVTSLSLGLPRRIAQLDLRLDVDVY